MAYIDPAFMKEIFNVSERQREPDVHHNGPADDPWARFEVAKRRGLGHAQTLGKPLPGSSTDASDIAFVTKLEWKIVTEHNSKGSICLRLTRHTYRFNFQETLFFV